MKRSVAVLAVAALALTAGCMGGGVVDEAALSESATYEWNTSADASVTIEEGEYRAVLTMANRTNVSLYGPGEFGGEAAIPISAVQYRFENGTVVNASAIGVTERNERTVIQVPTEGGQLGYSARVRSNALFLPVTINGSYAVTLPEGAAVSAPIVGRVTPKGFEVSSDDRTTIHWDRPDAEIITVDYYQERNLYVFGGLLAIAGLVAGGGLLYFRQQLRALVARRTAMEEGRVQ